MGVRETIPKYSKSRYDLGFYDAKMQNWKNQLELVANFMRESLYKEVVK